MQKIFILILLPCIYSLVALAQVPVIGAGQMGAAQMNVGNFYGKIIDDSSLKPIEGASVQLFQNKSDSNTKKRKEVVISTQVADKKGEFNIEGLPVLGSFKLQVSAIGYKMYDAKISFDLNTTGAKPGEMANMMQAVIKDLGNIKLIADAEQLENITVNASKPLLEMYLDKKIYNVEKDITATGGTALDVVKNIPSVNVDIEGNVTLRNASPQIFVDGRPSSLKLDQIPADHIASIELITNPSAKYDASGGGSGILNIVLKKNRKAGYNGNIRAGIDSRGRPSLGGDLNIKQNKINFFAAGQLFSRKNITTAISKRTDFLNPGTARILQENTPISKGFFAFGRMGIDYLVDNRNTLTLGGNIVRGLFTAEDLLHIFKDTVTPSYTSKESAVRNIFADISFKNAGASLSFKHNFAKASKEWTTDINFNESRNTNTSNYNSHFYDAAGNPKQTASAERATGGGNSKLYTIQTDFVNPLTKTSKLETGLRIAARNYMSWNDNFVQDPVTKKYILIDVLGVRYNFDDIVYAAYASYSRQLNGFSYQAGLRAESSNYSGNLLTKNQRFSNKYPISLFPSLFLSKKIDSKQDLQFNYSRKINRPNFFQILPFVDFSDSLNLTVGNPDLLPEFTHLVEFNYANQYKPGNSFLASLYAKYTDNLITRYLYKAPNTNPAKPDSVIFNSYANASESYTIGLELTAKNKLTKYWELTSNLNLFDVTLNAANLKNALDDQLFSWFIKLNNSFKLPRNYSIQLSGDYQAQTILPVNSGRGITGGMPGGGVFGATQNIAQGYIKPIYGADIAVKKEFLKNKTASLTLQFNDIFKTRRYATHAETNFFIQDNQRQRDPQVLRLNFNWRFGKIDAALFKRKNMKAETDNVPAMQ